MRLNLARLVFSQSCSLFLSVVSLRLRIISLMLSLSAATSPGASTLIDSRQVALGHGRGDFGDGTHLVGQVGGQLVHVVGQVFPGTGGPGHLGLAAQLAFDTHLAGHRGHLIGERGQGFDHAVDRVGQFGDFALSFDRRACVSGRRWPRPLPRWRYRAPGWSGCRP